jgi:hypothetical protein
MVHLIEEYMGRANKMVVMNQAGDYKILNEEAGSWESGVWFSNQTFRVYRTTYVGQTSGSYTYDADAWDSAYTPAATPPAPAPAAPAPAAEAPKTDETQVLPIVTDADADIPNDPLVVAIAAGQLTEEDRAILCIDIGCMSEAQFTRYEEIMEAVYGS